eukprot:5611846-Amphidinium_carterae.1
MKRTRSVEACPPSCRIASRRTCRAEKLQPLCGRARVHVANIAFQKEVLTLKHWHAHRLTMSMYVLDVRLLMCSTGHSDVSCPCSTETMKWPHEKLKRCYARPSCCTSQQYEDPVQPRVLLT